MRRASIAAGCLALVLTANSAVRAATISVDGNLSDWGVTVADNNGSTYAPSGLLGSHVEDTNDLDDNYYLGPNWGGQNYDAEFMGVARGTGVQRNLLYVAISTGQRPDNGFANYSPGDLRLVGMGANQTPFTLGIEFGGGAGGGTGSAITEGANGTTFVLNGNGVTTGVTHHATGLLAGSIWLNPTWILDPIAPGGPVQIQAGTGTYLGMVDYIFTRNSVTSQHSIFELALDLTQLPLGFGLQSAHWRPSCGNDELDVAFTPQLLTTSSGQEPLVPEPGTWALWTAGAVFLGAWQARRRTVRNPCTG